MATVKFFIKGNSNPSTIYVRFGSGRQHDYKRSTGLTVNPDHWSNNKGIVRDIAAATDKDDINNDLSDLKAHLTKTFNRDNSKGVLINGDWLSENISKHFNRANESDLNQFVDYGRYFIENLPHRVNRSRGGRLGVAPGTIKKYKSIVNKVSDFVKDQKRKLYIQDIGQKFQRDFIKYLREKEKLNENSVGRYLKFVKTICLDAKRHGIKTSPELDDIKGFTVKSSFIYLDENEIDKIYLHNFSKQPYLDNARNWLIVGVRTGLRVSDFMRLTDKNVKDDFIEVTTQKTNTKTLIPLHDQVIGTLEKLGGQFPYKISEQRFNDYIKEVAKQVGLNEVVEGAKMNPRTKRKEAGKFEKWELVSSHICRRSFSTNLYGKVPTPVIMSITGHTTEKMFLTYIGKTQKDNAQQLKEYWNNLNAMRDTKKSPLTVVKSQV